MSINLLNSQCHYYLDTLDWEKILGDLSTNCHFEVSREELFSHPVKKSVPEINDALDSLDYFFEYIEAIRPEIPRLFSHIPSGSQFFLVWQKLNKGQVLDFKEINFICLLFESYLSLITKFNQWPVIKRSQIDRSRSQSLKHKVLIPFRRFVETSGTINFEAHPKLAKIFLSLRSIEKEIRDFLREISKKEKFKNALQFSEHDIIDDRYVLAIRSDSYRNDLGQIIGRSKSGLTLFVEPFEIVSKCNERFRLNAKLQEEINRLAQEFCSLLTPFLPLVSKLQKVIKEIDLVYAKGIYCERYGFSRPKITSKFEIKLKNFFHPLIERPVLNSLHIPPEKFGLVISGPNTGGKTVSLKAICLSQLFMVYGLYVPAEEALLPFFDGVYYFGNDQQDLSEGLSSFASESKNYIRLIKETLRGGKHLIIIDEIFNSTSSDEASALGQSLFEMLQEKTKTKILVSTHHQLLKTLTHSNKSFISAHMGMSSDTNGPTYKLNIGTPGSSMAITIFEKMSKQENLKVFLGKKARGLLGRQHQQYEKLLQEISFKKQDLDSLLKENSKINRKLKNKEKSMEGLLYLEKEKTIKTFNQKLDSVLDRADQLVKEIKKGPQNFSKLKKESREIGQMKRELNTDFQPPQANQVERGASPRFENVKIGDFLFSGNLGKRVKVVGKNERKKSIQINVGPMTTWTPVTSLFLLQGGQNKAPEKIQVNVFMEPKGKIEIDGRGKKLEDFRKEVEDSVFELVNGEIPFLSIIHGHGDGILKNWVRKYLSDFDDIQWAPEDGNDGCTKVNRK